ncbi:putative p44-31 outer membrane protein, silent [Anaplasma phagocytophilum str. ApWI1]|uniref:Putative p44-31 outer membrane protein, silent n=2 Tax=Anaplasma phagocytophilum TaxID=948 RepID=A0A0F3NKQ7_ANAPH|nr:hypothetical protein [Anaplasma phagocytophilum]KJV60019.1 putative p44-31 outer membrane protein, silent [Anaplasma phagocytophilum str. Webster]KJZ99051.1 putative p44-31 outer membrane protein, silent [Anaplasma phagocytophilum str. CR1007]AGR79746.1 hypothetical protein YYU_06215 [Anaplasma phagocytophilum str. HZ2]AGR81006.1 hypothetical protein WSQ_06280 [Anaplasma phagocytophilum str. JM]AGR82263.1 hypothetical protein YYY_06295 [Anaplasma phagocytophilum str. Dog2]
MEISHPTIDGKICKTKDGASSGDKYGKYAAESDRDGSSNYGNVALCGAAGNSSNTGGSSPQFLKDFVKATLLGDGSKNWPTSTAKSGTGQPTPKPNDNAKAVAKDLVKELTPEEKTIVAGLLAKTIEGGEVVEMCLSPST